MSICVTLLKLFLFHFTSLLASLSLVRLASACYFSFPTFPFFFFFPYCCLLTTAIIFFYFVIDIAIVNSITNIDMAVILLPLQSRFFCFGFYRCLICKLLSVEQSMMTTMRQFRSLCTRSYHYFLCCFLACVSNSEFLSPYLWIFSLLLTFSQCVVSDLKTKTRAETAIYTTRCNKFHNLLRQS